MRGEQSSRGTEVVLVERVRDWLIIMSCRGSRRRRGKANVN
jgi:hypothetical protein